MSRYRVNELIKGEFLITQDAIGITGQTPVVIIKRKSDLKYWDGASWKTNPTTLSMVEEDSINLPGAYYYLFDLNVADLDAEDDYMFAFGNAGIYAGTAISEYQVRNEVSGADLTVTRIAYLDTIPTIELQIGSFSGSGGDDIKSKLDLLWKIRKGRWKIDTGQSKWIFYDTNGTDILIQFNLKDQNGHPVDFTTTNSFERVPI